MSRVARLRKEFPELAEKKPGRQSRREKRLEHIRAAEPAFVPPTMDDLIAVEIIDEGTDAIAGGAGLAPGVMLKVYRRDVESVAGCPPDKLHFVVAAGIQPEVAEFDQVRLECDVPKSDSGHTDDSNNDTPETDSR